MTTAYTTLLGLALPVTGELAGTWGTVVNTSITQLVEDGLAGTTTLSSDADVTLTTTRAPPIRRAALLSCGQRRAPSRATSPRRRPARPTSSSTPRAARSRS